MCCSFQLPRFGFGSLMHSVLIVVLFLAVPVWAADLYVAKNGRDSNDGSKKKPFLTINHAAQIANPGDTVIVSGGVYREWVNPARGGNSENERITYMAAPGERVVISGAENVKGWKKKGDGIWIVKLPNTFFGELNPYAELIRHPEVVEQDESGDGWGWLKYGREAHRGDVVLGYEGLTEKHSRDDLTKPMTWYAEVGDKKTTIWANFGDKKPNTQGVEISVREQAFSPSKAGLDYINVRGLVFSQVANHWAPPTEYQPGVIAPNGGANWIIENNVINYAKAVAISIGQPTENVRLRKRGRHIVKNNIIWRPGQAGIAGQQWNQFSQVIGNVIEDVNYRMEFGGWETAAIKFHVTTNMLIENNFIRDVYTVDPEIGAAHGIWVDFFNTNFEVNRNVITGSQSHSILFEANIFGPNIASNNIIFGGSLATMSSQDEVWVHNLFVDTDAFWENQPWGGRQPIKRSRWFNNVFVGGGLDKLLEDPTIKADKNLYLADGAPAKIEKESVVSSYNPKFALREDNDGVYLAFDWKPQETVSPLRVSASNLDLPLKDVGSNEINGITDFFGKNFDDDSLVGPFANLEKGQNKILVYRFPDGYAEELAKRP